jgi:ethanolamine utilization protein EutN
MHIGKIIGTVVSTRKDEGLVGYKLLVTQPLTQEMKPLGETIVAVDTVGAGVGEIVLYVLGSVAPYAVGKSSVPIDAAVVGIIDKVEIS